MSDSYSQDSILSNESIAASEELGSGMSYGGGNAMLDAQVALSEEMTVDRADDTEPQATNFASHHDDEVMTTTGNYPADFNQLGDGYESDGIVDPSDRPATDANSSDLPGID